MVGRRPCPELTREVPQLVKTFRLKRAGELSPFAFAIWLVADCLIVAAIATQGLLITNLVLCGDAASLRLTRQHVRLVCADRALSCSAVFALSNGIVLFQHFWYSRWPGGLGGKHRVAPRLDIVSWLDRLFLLLFVSLPLIIWAAVICAHRRDLVQRPGFDGVDARLVPAPFALSCVGVALYEVRPSSGSG